MELPLHVVAHCEARGVIYFFTIENKSAVEIHREVCSHHCRIICIDIQLPYTKHISLWISTTDLFCMLKKWITACTSQGATTHDGSFIFNATFCTFLWSDCYTILLPETQKLYLPAISPWSNRETYFWDNPCIFTLDFLLKSHNFATNNKILFNIHILLCSNFSQCLTLELLQSLPGSILIISSKLIPKFSKNLQKILPIL